MQIEYTAVQLEGGQVVAILLVVVCSLGYPGLGWSTEKCVQRGMHKLIKSATLHGYGCYGKDTENLHQ